MYKRSPKFTCFNEETFFKIIYEINNIDEVVAIMDPANHPMVKNSRIFDIKIWQGKLLNSGLRKLIQMLQLYCMDSYECYLIRMIWNLDCNLKKQKYVKLLDSYYLFIGAFEVPPFIHEMDDNCILYDNGDERREGGNGERKIENEFFPLYKTKHDYITMGEVDVFKENVLEILKSCSEAKNMHEIQHYFFDLCHMDEEFRKKVST
jgi:hypothetical protein